MTAPQGDKLVDHRWGPSSRRDHHSPDECLSCGTHRGSPRSFLSCRRFAWNDAMSDSPTPRTLLARDDLEAQDDT